MTLVIKTTGFADFLDGDSGAHIKVLVMGQPGSGKGHPLTTNVLTPSGWRQVGDLVPGDEVIGSLGKPVTVTGVFDRGALPVYDVGFSDGAHVRVDGDHLWRVRSYKQRRTTGAWSVRETRHLSLLADYEVPLVAPVQLPDAELPVEPYLLGVLLGDGYLRDDATCFYVGFGDEFIATEVQRRSPGLEIRETTGVGGTARRYGVRKLLPALRELGLTGLRSGTKFVPERYLLASEDQRRALLAGLMDTDGSVSKGRRPAFTTTSPALVQAVLELVRSLGGVAHVGKVSRPGEYYVSLAMPVGANPFLLPRKAAGVRPDTSRRRRIVSVEPDGIEEVRCISVDADDSLYVTEDYLLTHNTRSASFFPRPIFADCEKGRMSIADRGVPYADVRSSAQMEELLNILDRECRKGADRAYDTLVIDTLDSYQRTVIQERLTKEKRESLSGWADWGYLDAKMTQFVERLLNLPMNIVVNLHVKETTEGDDDSRILVMAPKLKGDIRDQIAAEFDLVGYMSTYWFAENGERVLKRKIRWAPEPKYPILKDRSGRLPLQTDVDFTTEDFSRIFSAVVGDNVDALPESTVIGEYPTEPEVAPAGPDEKGGAVATVKQFPRKPSDKQDPPPPPKTAAEVPMEVDATGESAPKRKGVTKKAEKELAKELAAEAAEQNAKVDAQEAAEQEMAQEIPPEGVANESSQPQVESPPTPDLQHDEAVEAVSEALGGEVISESAPAEVPTGPVCGDQPDHMVGKGAPAPGCGKSLADEDRNRVNIALLRTKTLLCNECFQTWKAAN